MILERPTNGPRALSEVIGYRGGNDRCGINGDWRPWLNLMRNSLNAQIWSFKHPEFLVVSATTVGHLALFQQTMWTSTVSRKWPGQVHGNTLLDDNPPVHRTQRITKAPRSISSHDNSIPALQRRGSSFCRVITRFGTSRQADQRKRESDKLSLDHSRGAHQHVIPSAIVTPAQWNLA